MVGSREHRPGLCPYSREQYPIRPAQCPDRLRGKISLGNCRTTHLPESRLAQLTRALILATIQQHRRQRRPDREGGDFRGICPTTIPPIAWTTGVSWGACTGILGGVSSPSVLAGGSLRGQRHTHSTIFTRARTIAFLSFSPSTRRQRVVGLAPAARLLTANFLYPADCACPPSTWLPCFTSDGGWGAGEGPYRVIIHALSLRTRHGSVRWSGLVGTRLTGYLFFLHDLQPQPPLSGSFLSP